MKRTAAAEKDGALKANRRATLLLVEDDRLLVDLLEKKFRLSTSYRVLTASDGESARKIFASEPNIDLVLLDLVLPDADGFTLLQEFKGSTKKNIPVVIISNLGQEEEIARGKALGATDYIIKADALPGEIVRRVDTILDERKR
ncbi:MAG: response regulator [Patescibacteria group bacterium]